MKGKEIALYHPRAWVYARGDSGSPVLQDRLDELGRIAQMQGYEIVGQSSDARHRLLPRYPGRAGLLRAVRRGQVDDVFITRLSQLSHKACCLRRILRLLRRKRVHLHTTESDLRYDLYRHGLDSILI